MSQLVNNEMQKLALTLANFSFVICNGGLKKGSEFTTKLLLENDILSRGKLPPFIRLKNFQFHDNRQQASEPKKRREEKQNLKSGIERRRSCCRWLWRFASLCRVSSSCAAALFVELRSKPRREAQLKLDYDEFNRVSEARDGGAKKTGWISSIITPLPCVWIEPDREKCCVIIFILNLDVKSRLFTRLEILKKTSYENLFYFSFSSASFDFIYKNVFFT